MNEEAGKDMKIVIRKIQTILDDYTLKHGMFVVIDQEFLYELGRGKLPVSQIILCDNVVLKALRNTINRGKNGK